MVDVPDLSMLSLSEVERYLATANLAVGTIDSLHHPVIPAEHVIGQSPLPGQLAEPGTGIWVTKSLGPQIRSVPDLVGIGSEAATVLLQGSGFGVVFDTVASNQESGQVVETHPPAHTELPLPNLVVMTVSKGPPPIPMPQIAGMMRDDAILLLDSLGLVVADIDEVFQFGADLNRVIHQEPVAGTEVKRGERVRLTVSWDGRLTYPPHSPTRGGR